jgi:hypothetical protein
MPAMIDLMIAEGRLNEGDGPRCVHWSEMKDARPLSDEEIAKIGKADNMLQKAGVQTRIAAAWDAYVAAHKRDAGQAVS